MVDAIGSSAGLGLGGHADRRTARPDALGAARRRRRRAPARSAARPTRSAPARATASTRARCPSRPRAARARTSSATRPVAATTPPTSAERPPATARCSPTPTTCGATASTSDRATAGVDAHYGAQVTFDYYKNVLGRNGIFNNGAGVRSRVHYGNALLQRLLGRQPDDVRRRGGQRPSADLDRHRRPRDEPRRHREHREPHLLRRVRRPQRGHQRHLRHRGRVLRQQRQRPRRLPDRREGRHQRQRHPAALHGQAQPGRRIAGLLVLRCRRASTCTTRPARRTTCST